MPMPKVYEERCDGCGKCMELCSEYLFGTKNPDLAAIKIQKNGDSFKVTGCWECGKCAEACPEKAIKKTLRGVYKIDEKTCNGCGKCVEACPNGTMIFPEKCATPQKCKKCGKCVMGCPNKVFDH